MKKKIVLLTLCVVLFLCSSCIAETQTMTRISGSDYQTRFTIVDNQVYFTLEKEGWFSNHYSLYSVVPGDEPYLISSFRGYYSMPVVYRGKWLINKLDVTPLTHYINSSIWCTLGLDGSIKPFNTMEPFNTMANESELGEVFDIVTNSMLFRTIKQDSQYHVMFLDTELSKWRETGVQASDYMPRHFDSLVFSTIDHGASECQVFDVVDCDFFYIPKFYDESIHAAILYEKKLFCVDKTSVILYDVTTEKCCTIYAYDQYPHGNGSCNIFLQGESIFFGDPSSKQIFRYDLSTKETVRTKARSNSCSEFVVVGDWVYSISEDKSSCLYLLVSNLLTGEEFLSVLPVK